MEKLILKGVMWGADKIPDSVFHSVPGGFYKPEDEKNAKKNKGHGDRSHRSRHTHSEDESQGDSRSHDDKSHRSDARRRYSQPGHARKSYDGPHDDYDEVNNRPRRQRSRMMRDDYSDDDDEPRGYHESHARANRGSRYDDFRPNGRAPYLEQPLSPHIGSPDHPPMGPGAFAATSTAYTAPGHPQSTSPSSQSSSISNGGMAGAYVPYANIYGQPIRDQPAQPFSPPPSSNASSVQPNFKNQVGPPVAKRSYQQNPYAQEAAPGSQPSYMPDPRYNPRHQDNQYNDQQYDRYDAYGRNPDRSSPERQRSRRGRSSSRDSYDSRESPDRSDRRTQPDSRAKSQGRGKSRLREKFDTSQRGLGYGAVGALAGGLVGSEIGKGAVPAAIGAAVGALGANVFEARERKRHDARDESYHRDGTYLRGQKKHHSRMASEEGQRSD